MKTIKNLKAEEIRKSILQLAIQGKLVKQDPNDEPASELVKRIYVEKQKLIKEGKIKKDKNESYIFKGDDNCYYEKIGNNKPIKLEDLPFDIPDNWTWIRLKNISSLNGGYAFKSDKFSNDGVRVIRISDFDEKGIKNNDIKRYPYSKELDSYLIIKNDILLCMTGGTVGKSVYIQELEENCYINQRVALIRISKINTYYFFSVLKSSYIFSVINTSKTSTNDNISMKSIEDFLIPIPPLNEEIRIVEKINSFEILIHKYEIAESKLSKLESEFPEKLKKSILQYAIEGKLVKQDPNDEPASVLLECIKTEKEKLIKEGKIKRDKNESYIYQGDDKNYYENLPQGWVICSLGNLATYKKGPFGSSLTKGMFVPDTYPNRIKVYEQKNAIQHDSNLGNYYISYEKYQEMLGFKVNPLDFIVSCAGTIGEIYKLPYNAKKGIINQALMKVTLINEEISDYFEIIFYNALHKLSEKSKGTAIKNIAPFEILKPALIQLPPLEEQKRILKKLSIISTLVDC